jgi:photosystem II stability/assembly factor-like uncharacterized protein
MGAAAGDDFFDSLTVALDPDDSSVVYVPGRTSDGRRLLLVSSDGGLSWFVRASLPPGAEFNHLVFFGSRMLLGTRDSGVYVSDDRGITWEPLNAGLRARATVRFVVFNGRLYLVGGRFQFNMRAGGDLYRLNGIGTRWQRVRAVRSVTGAGTDGTTLWVGNQFGELWRTGDGHRFTQVSARGLPPGSIGEILAADRSTLYIGLGSSGVFRSKNGGASFREWNKGLRSIATREVHVNPDNARHIYVGSWDRGGLYESRNAGRTYRRIGKNYGILTIAPDPHSFKRVVAGGDRLWIGKVGRSRVAWTEVRKPGPHAAFVKALAVSPRNGKVILAGLARNVRESQAGRGLWYTRNAGRSWKRAKGIPNKAVYTILFNPKNPAVVYASALGAGVYKSTNGGRRFVRIGPASLKYTYRLAISSRDPDHLVAGSNLFFAGLSPEEQRSVEHGGIFESRDGGVTWAELTAHVRDYDGSDDPAGFQEWLFNFGHLPNFEQIVIDPGNSNRIFVGHHGESVITTVDGGHTWQKQSAGMLPGRMHNYAYCLGTAPAGDVVYACSCGRGLFRGTVSKRTGQILWAAASSTSAVQPTWSTTETARTSSLAAAKQALIAGLYSHQH